MQRFTLNSVGLGLALALLRLLAPSLPASRDLARLCAELTLALLLLLSAWSAPITRASGVRWAAGSALGLALCFLLEADTNAPHVLGLVTALVLITGGLVGGYVGGLLEHPGMLMVVAYVAALGDCFSVMHPNGLTAKVLAAPRLLSVLALSSPVLGTAEVVPMVGIGDVALLAIFVVGARATGLSVRRTLIALACALATVAACVELGRVALPAVPFMSAAVVLAHREVRTLPPALARRIAINLLVVTLALGALLLAGRARSEHSAAAEPRAPNAGA
jgi:hypothetical protein